MNDGGDFREIKEPWCGYQVDGESMANESGRTIQVSGLFRGLGLSLATSKAGSAFYCCSSDCDVHRVFESSWLSAQPSFVWASSSCCLVVGGSMC